MKKQVKVVMDNMPESRLFSKDYRVSVYEYKKYFFGLRKGWRCIEWVHSDIKQDLLNLIEKWKSGYDIISIEDKSEYNGKDNWADPYGENEDAIRFYRSKKI